MKYAPKKVFIKENENDIEISNEEHECHKASEYSHRRFILLQGYLLEVDEVLYTDYYREVEREQISKLARQKEKDRKANTAESVLSEMFRISLVGNGVEPWCVTTPCSSFEIGDEYIEKCKIL